MKYMTKRVRLTINGVKKAKDKEYINEVFDNIIESLYDHEGVVSGIGLSKQPDLYYLSFSLKVSKLSDILMILINEWLSCIVQTETSVHVSIFSKEQDDKYEIENKLIAHYDI